MLVQAGPGLPGLKKVSVWSYAFGLWSKGGEYDPVISAPSLQDLLERLQRSQLKARVRKLVVFAHGDNGGLVQIKSGKGTVDNLTPKTVNVGYAKYIRKIKQYLTSDGVIAFYGCISAQGPEGDALLARVSELLKPTQTVVGFTTFLWKGNWALKHMAGQVKDSGKLRRISVTAESAAYKGKPYLTIRSDNAKWFRGGKKEKVATLDYYPPKTINRKPAWVNKQLWYSAGNLKKLTQLVKEEEKKGNFYWFSAYFNKQLWAKRFNVGPLLKLLREWEAKGIYYKFDKEMMKKDYKPPPIPRLGRARR